MAAVEPQSVLFLGYRGIHGKWKKHNKQEEEEEEGDEDTRQRRLVGQESTKLMNFLLSHHPGLVEEGEVLFGELVRVSELWEEKWLLLLQRLGVVVGQRLVVLREALSSQAPEEEKREMYDAAMRPVVMKLGGMVEETFTKGVASAHEVAFLLSFRKKLMDACLLFADPVSASSLVPSVDLRGNDDRKTEGREKEGEGKKWERGWALFQGVEKELKSSIRLKLKLADISPCLASFRSEFLQIPTSPSLSLFSLSSSSQKNSRIQGIESMVLVLPTKTKPKKMQFVGEDGRFYSFLVKGREDLRLDERITQFLRLFDSMLSSSSNGGGRARSYAVFPLSGRCGLIQWVDDSLPLFTVYKKWQKAEKMGLQFEQQQQQQKQQAQQEDDGNDNNNGEGNENDEDEGEDSQPPPQQAQPLGLLDSFKWKLMTVLRSRGLSHLKTRKECPDDVLLAVYRMLLAETPSNLLSSELWLTSGTSKEWRGKVRAYSQSMAVASMVGHILGLGDRHLDNILMDFGTGEITHIDYNVCFERGVTLRVPETVPFRLTQNMETALGVGSMRGAFKVCGSKTLEVVRKNRRCLLSLLECFLWDPLEEWVSLSVSSLSSSWLFGDSARIFGDVYTQLLGFWVLGRERGGMEESLSLVRDTFWSLGGLLGKVRQMMEVDKRQREEKVELDRKQGEKEAEVRAKEKEFSSEVSLIQGIRGKCLEAFTEKKGMRIMLEKALEQCELWQKGFEAVFGSLSDLQSLSSFRSIFSSPLSSTLQGVQQWKKDPIFLSALHGPFVDNCQRLDEDLEKNYQRLCHAMEDSFGLLLRYRNVVGSLFACEGSFSSSSQEFSHESAEQYLKQNKCYEWSILLQEALEKDSQVSSPFANLQLLKENFFEEASQNEELLGDDVRLLKGVVEKGRGRDFVGWLSGVVERRGGRNEGLDSQYDEIVAVSQSFCENFLFASTLRELLERNSQKAAEGGARKKETERIFMEFIQNKNQAFPPGI